MKRTIPLTLIARNLSALMLIIFACLTAAHAQTTSFTYQGRLTDTLGAANGTYDLQFAIYDVATGGSPLVSTITRTGVAVTNGVFTVQLDFDLSAFTNAVSASQNRFIKVSVKKPSNSTYTTLTPR